MFDEFAELWNRGALEKHLYATPGEHVYSEKIPPLALQHDGLRIQFAVDEPFSFGEDDRDLPLPHPPPQNEADTCTAQKCSSARSPVDR